MLSGEMARYQIADRVRDAEVDRMARSTRRAKVASRQTFARKIGRAAVAVAQWPVKH